MIQELGDVCSSMLWCVKTKLVVARLGLAVARLKLDVTLSSRPLPLRGRRCVVGPGKGHCPREAVRGAFHHAVLVAFGSALRATWQEEELTNQQVCKLGDWGRPNRQRNNLSKCPAVRVDELARNEHIEGHELNGKAGE
jgi:hypothetical protein